MNGEVVEGRTSDRAQQYGVGGEAGLQRVLRQWVAAAGKGGADDVFSRQAELVAEGCGYGFEDTDGFVGHFGTDAVSGEDCDLQEHAGLL